MNKNGKDDSDHRPEGRPVSLDSLPKYVPGAATSAPKRNILVGLAYLFASLFAVGLLWTAL